MKGKKDLFGRWIAAVLAAAVFTALFAAPALGLQARAGEESAAAAAEADTEADTDIDTAVDSPVYTEKEFPVIYSEGEDDTTVLRFYDAHPEAAYISAAEYLRIFMPGAEMDVQQEENGIYTLVSPTGKARVDVERDIISSDDLIAFTNVMGMVQEGMPGTYLDGMPYIRFTGYRTIPVKAPVRLDLSAYDIDLLADEKGVYIPFVILNDLYSDLFYHIGFFNGETVVINNRNETFLPFAILTDYIVPIIREKERSEAEARFIYNEFCFAIDNLYGYPGRTYLEAEGLEENGLDATLTNMGPLGEDVRMLLLSTDPAEYLAGMNIMSLLLEDGGHTFLSYLALNMGQFYRHAPAVISSALDLYSEYLNRYPELMDIVQESQQASVLGQQVSEARQQVLGSGTYHKYGSTALIVFDSFMPHDDGAWKAYYEGKGPMPTPQSDPDDMMAIFLDGLKRAEEDPEVRNVVIDIASNGGGSLDLVMTLLSLVGGESCFYMQNSLTGQLIRTDYEVDRNFDRVFDEKDQEVHYDLHFAVLTSGYSFSCANLFPSRMQDQGFPVIGERSGGGACALQIMQTADGYPYIISSFRAKLCNKRGESIDGGVPVDVEILGDNYQKLFDLKMLDEIMNGLFETEEETEEEELAPAA